MTSVANNKPDSRQEGVGVSYHFQQVGNVNVFYREAGDPSKPTILLLHGFPSSSVQFRELMPELMDDYHLIAPDMPGFGQTDAPVKPFYAYTFDNLAKTMRPKSRNTLPSCRSSDIRINCSAPLFSRYLPA